MTRSALAVAAVALVAASPSASAPRGGTLLAFVSDEHANRLLVVQPISGRVVRRIPVPRGPHNVASSPDGRWVLVTSPPAGAVTIVDATRLRVVATLRGLRSPHDVEVAPSSRYAYVTEERADRVAVVSLTTRRVVHRISVGRRPHDLAASPDGTVVWVTHGAGGRALTVVESIRPSRARVVRRVPARAGAPHDISFDRFRVWVTYWGSGRVGAYAPSTGAFLFTRRAGDLTHHVLAANGRVWVTDHHGARATVFDDAGRRLRTLRTGPAPHHVETEAGVAVVVGSTGTLSVFREQSFRPIRTMRLGEHLHGVALVFAP